MSRVFRHKKSKNVLPGPDGGAIKKPFFFSNLYIVKNAYYCRAVTTFLGFRSLQLVQDQLGPSWSELRFFDGAFSLPRVQQIFSCSNFHFFYFYSNSSLVNKKKIIM